MTGEDKLCVHCVAAECRAHHDVFLTVETQDGEHNGMPYHLTRITVGGDKGKCEDIADIVKSYVTGVLGVPVAEDKTGRSTI